MRKSTQDEVQETLWIYTYQNLIKQCKRLPNSLFRKTANHYVLFQEYIDGDSSFGDIKATAWNDKG